MPNLQNLSTTVPSRAGAVRRPDFALRPQTHAGLMNSNQHHLRASQFSGARTTAYPRFPQPCHQSRQSHSDPCTSSVQIRFIPVSLPSSRTRHRRILRLISPPFQTAAVDLSVARHDGTRPEVAALPTRYHQFRVTLAVRSRSVRLGATREVSRKAIKKPSPAAISRRSTLPFRPLWTLQDGA